MSDPPIPSTVDLPLAGNSSRRSIIIAWVIIILCVAGTVLKNVLPEVGAGPPGYSPWVQVDMMSKYVIGIHSLFPGATAPLVQQLDAMPKSIDQKTHIIMVIAELEGADSAMKRLDALEKEIAETQPPLISVSQRIYARDIAAVRTIYSAGPDALPQEERDMLILRHGYVARVALTYGKSPQDPARQAVLLPSQRVAIGMIAGFAVGAISAFVGLVLLIIAVVMMALGKVRRLYEHPLRAEAVFVEMFAIYIVLAIAFPYLLYALGARSSLQWAWVQLIIIPVAIVWGLWRGAAWRDLQMGLGWHRGRGVIWEIPLGIVGYLAGLPVLIVGLVITFILIRLAGTMPTHPVLDMPVDSAGKILLMYGIACIWAPFMEETMFRGALFHHLRGRFGWLISASIVALIFAAIHPQGWTTIPALGAVAIVLAGLREWRGSILPAMTAHALHNFVMISLLVLVKR